MKNNILLFLVTSILSVACNEVFEDDLTSSEVLIVAPSDSVETVYSNQVFKWEELDGADFYTIRIVTPSFEKTELYILDSNLTQTTFSYTFSPGTYQWGISASNYSTTTPFSVRTIIIDTNRVFANKRIELVLPTYSYSNSYKQYFSWNSLEGADSYRFELRVDDWYTGNTYFAKDLVEDTISVTLTEGAYYWGVNGQDDETNTNTEFSNKQLIIDVTAPSIPSLVSPVDKDTIRESSVTLKWERGEDFGSPIFDSLYLATDIAFSNLVYSVEVNDTSYTIQPNIGEYYWRVKSYDQAGNNSAHSIYRKLIVE